MTALKINETGLKSQIKGFLAIRGIFNFPLVQGLGAYRGVPDRCAHVKGRVVYLEIKLPKGKLSEHQLRFQAQCLADKVDYWVIHSIEELQEKLKEV